VWSIHYFLLFPTFFTVKIISNKLEIDNSFWNLEFILKDKIFIICFYCKSLNSKLFQISNIQFCILSNFKNFEPHIRADQNFFFLSLIWKFMNLTNCSLLICFIKNNYKQCFALFPPIMCPEIKGLFNFFATWKPLCNSNITSYHLIGHW